LIKRIQCLAMVAAAGALLAVPAIGEAHHEAGHTKGGHTKGGHDKRCKKPTVNKGFVVKGTLVSYTADNPATPANEATPLVITVTKANGHARRSGELTTPDANPLPGVQFTVPTSDAFRVTLDEYEAGEVPGAGDKVRISGKVAVTKKKCATAEQDTLAERYGAVNVRRVKFTEQD
jgi:hypothetical protein